MTRRLAVVGLALGAGWLLFDLLRADRERVVGPTVTPDRRPDPLRAPAATVAPQDRPPMARRPSPPPPPPRPVACVLHPDATCFLRVEGRDFVAGAGAESPDGPPRRVRVEPFWLQQSELPVTVVEHCVAAGACRKEGVDTVSVYANFGRPERRMMPANGLSYAVAAEACAYLGARLPTAEEWEAAARFGNVEAEGVPPFKETCGNTWYLGACKEGGTRMVAPMAGPLSFSGLAGNVLEWVSTPVNERGEREGRGGSWSSLDADEVRPTRRSWLDAAEQADDTGVRCALDGAVLTATGRP